ncbi:hypothetical protein COO91_08705 [Nostoc flagelliforme CCNUN1]|uniref:Uncharacterized protein n=1 Tax=Nostoc flagelliforme CCNUN1 TaxID=2038116 RepID=A0A2K8T4Q6_9NOSO|nr:hypothetical protein [Nostoc flagelliforme]AUB42563.1 hypothetical protein COO91_08705 [Nostoc flagelliforme CCNUN1]
MKLIDYSLTKVIKASQESDRIPNACKETFLFLRSRSTGSDGNENTAGIATRYEWKKQVKSSSLLPSASCLVS